MPRSVDHDERRKEIARAANRLIAKSGSRGLTLRALADELGGSITMITHFLPNRRAILDAATAQLIEDSSAELADIDAPDLTPAERLRRFLIWLLPTTENALALERSRVLMTTEPDTRFVREFYDAWETTIRALVQRYIAPLVPPPELEFYTDLLRVVQNGVVLSAVEHPDYWTREKQLAFIGTLIPLVEFVPAPLATENG
jgi:AcrR family transcriptional regulator